MSRDWCYRSDIEYKFDMKPDGFQGLIDNVDRDMTFAIEVEGGIDRRKITNYDEVRIMLWVLRIYCVICMD